MPRSTVASICADVCAPIARMTRSFAASLIMPVGSPFASRSITPPGTSGVLRSIRSEEHTSEIQSLMRISYSDFCLKKKHNQKEKHIQPLPYNHSSIFQSDDLIHTKNIIYAQKVV